MKNKKVSIIYGKDEFELIKRMNDDLRDFFATQPKQKSDGSWVCFCYYNEWTKETSKEKSEELASEKQLNFIYSRNISVNTENLTKKQAKKIIGEYINNIDKK